MKNCYVSWFSHGQLKISKCSISLAWLGECSKSKVTPLDDVKKMKGWNVGTCFWWAF